MTISETSPNPWGNFIRNAANTVIDTAATVAVSRQNIKEAESQQETASLPPPKTVTPSATTPTRPFPWEKVAIGLGAIAAIFAIVQGAKALRIVQGAKALGKAK